MLLEKDLVSCLDFYQDDGISFKNESSPPLPTLRLSYLLNCKLFKGIFTLVPVLIIIDLIYAYFMIRANSYAYHLH
jgi:hypothetical protein